MSEVKITTVTSANLRLRQLKKSSAAKNNDTLVIFFSWLGASSNALNNYFELYHSSGHDVLHVPGYAKHFAWPPTSVLLAKTVLEYVCKELSHYRFILVHSISIGSYNYTSCLMEMNKHPQKYWSFIIRHVGNVFDSITYGSYDHMRVGVSYGFTKNALVQVLLQQIFALYFVLTKSTTVDFYDLGVRVFKDNQADVPSIFFYSRNDPLCEYKMIDEMVEIWRKKMSVPVLSVCWDTSIHAGHFFRHKSEYMLNHSDFMQSVEMFKISKNKSRL